MANFGMLNNDVYVDVLSKLPTKDLLRFKCVCKRWCQLISDPYFRRVHSQRREPISGFFLQVKDELPSNAYIPVQLQGAGFHHSIFDFLPEEVEILASCNGLIFCQGSLSKQDPTLYVCNPLKKEWMQLNCTKTDITDSNCVAFYPSYNIGLAFDPCQDTADRRTNFKLVSVRHFDSESEDLYFEFNTYSSDTGSWTKSKEICHHRDHIFRNNATFIEGSMHWFTDSGCIIAFKVQNNESRVIQGPFSDLHEDGEVSYAWCIGESDGKLHFILVFDYGIRVWCLEDYVEVIWNLKHSRSVEVIVEENPILRYKRYYKWPMHPLAFKNGYLLMVCSDIFLYNIETNKMDEVFSVSELPEHNHSSIMIGFPYAMSLVPLN